MARGVREEAPVLSRFHPLVRDWFKETFGDPSAPQREGWPAIATRQHTLILAPTGTGKTLAAFLWELNDLIMRGAEEALPTRCSFCTSLPSRR
jgi:ATP-dependent Lhr-like helicase